MNASLVLLCLLLAAAAFAQAPARVGDTVLSMDFESQADRDQWSKLPAATWATVEGRGQCLQITVPAAQATGGNMSVLPLDLSAYRGCTLTFECLAKADNASKPPANYLGVKYMLHYQSATNGPMWRNQNDLFGTFDWKKLAFSVPIAPDATGGEISLGLQGSSGTVWFDDLKVKVSKLPPPPRPKPMANPPPAFKGHNLPRLRGVMSPNQFNDEDLRVLGQDWKANVIRWQMTRTWGRPDTDRDLAEYDQWLSAELDDLDKVLEACRRYGLKVVVDLHSPPGGRYKNNECAIFHEKLYADHWVTLWERIARRYQGNPVVWGYDLINEPVQSTESRDGLGDTLEGQVRVAKAIRVIDPVMPIIIEAAEWDSPAAYAEMQPVDLPNIIYQVHMYVPHEFTHQGVNGSKTGISYPGTINGREWNKETLRQVLQPVRDFQLAYNVHLYNGEFSAIRWAPGASAANYLRDVIELFEEYGWDWTYHAYREWDGWSLEHGADPADHSRTKEPGDRRQLLLSWFAQNEKPRF